MNEQAFKDLYQEFVKTGYLGTEKDFKILMGTDSDAFNDGFSQFATTGYNGDSDAFAELIGVSNPLKKKEDSTFVAPEQKLALDTEGISSAIQPQTEQDYFEGTFGDILRGFDSVSPIGLGDFIDDMARSVAGGYNQGTVADVSSDILMRGADATEEDILKYIEANKDAQKFGPSDEMMEYLDTYKENGEGFMGVIMGLGKAGLTVIPEVLLSSITAMASSQKAVTSGLAVAGTAAAYGGAVGALAGGVGAGPGALAAGAASLPYAFAAAGATLEMGATFSELLQEEIEGELTPEKIREALNNEETYTSIRNKAIARGFTIGVIDAFTGRVGGKIAGKILSKGGKTITKAQKIKSIGAASAVEGVGGSAGEATARAVIGQDMDISEIALEGIAEVPGGIKDVISARYSKPKYKVNGKKVDASTIDDLIETMNLDQLQSTKIKIDNDYEGRDQKLQDKVLQLNTERLILEANPDINPETLAEITKLQLELSKLDGNKTEVAKEKAGVIKAKIKDLQENQLETEVETDADVFLELEQGQQIRYLDQAGKELVAEAEARGDEDFNISEEQSLARAVELFNKDQSTQGATKPKAAAKATTLNNLVNRPVTLTELGGSPLETPIEGDLYIEGQQVVIEDSDGNITEIGNVDEVLQKPLSEIGVKQDVSNISIDNDGNLNFNDKTLVPEKSGIKINKRGEISRVVLRSPDGGETVTLRGVNAEEAAYQILLKEAESMDTFPKSGQASASPKKINEILEQDEEFQNELREAENTAETKTDQDTTEVTSKEETGVKEERYKDSQIPVSRQKFTYENDNGETQIATVTTQLDGSRKLQLSDEEGTPFSTETISKDNTLTNEEYVTRVAGDIKTTEEVDIKTVRNPKLESRMSDRQRKASEQKVSKDRSLKEDVRSKVNKAANGDGKDKFGFANKWFNPIIMEIAGLETDKQIKEYYIQSLENNEPIAKINKDFYAKEFKRLGIDANLYIKKDSKAKVESAPDVTKPATEVAPKVETEEETNTYSKRVNTLIGLNSNFREDNGEVVMGGISVKVEDLLAMTSTEFNDFIEFTKKKFKIETVNDNQSTGVKREKLSNIDTDENRFQGRAALNEDVVNNIASNWSDSDQDPIQIWKDPKNNKTYVLSGHHRFAAAKLAGKSDIKIIDRTNDFNESQAIKFATEDANANRTMETPLERANTLRKKRKKGDSKKELNDFVKREGKNKVFVENLSFLNPKGVIFQTLSRFSNNTDKQTQNKLEKIADWIGDARKRNSKLTDSHEKELFDFLNNKEQSKRFTNKTDFLSKVNSLTSEMFFDETKPLNIAKFKNKTEGEKQYDKDVSNQKEAIQKLEDKEKNIRDRFNNPNNENYINPNDSAYDSIKKRANNVLKDVEAKLKFERAKLLDIYKNKGKYNRAGINQVGMFDEQADNARKALKKLDKDIKIVIHTDDASYRKASGEESREQSTRGEYNPATKTININATKAQANTIAHEVFHALLLRNGISNKQAKAITDRMLKAVKKTASPELLARLEKFSSNYESSLQSEESIAELFGILASEYKSLDKPTQNIIQKWINKLAKLMGVKSFTDAEIIDLLNMVSAKVEAGQEITGQDVKILDSKKPKKTSKESRKQIIGENAELSQNVKDNLIVAKQMENAKESAKDIRIATGWERGADGKWRYEISDGVFDLSKIYDSYEKTLTDKLSYKGNGVGLKNRIIQRILDRVTVFNKEDRTYFQSVIDGNNDLGGINNITQKEETGAKMFIDSLVDGEKLNAKTTVKTDKNVLNLKTNLGTILDSRLLEMYPQLSSVSIDIKIPSYGVSSEKFGKSYAVKGVSKEGLIEIIGRNIAQTPEESFQKQILQIESVLLHEIQHEIQNIEGFALGGNLEMFKSESDPFKKYKKLGGEVEARNVQKRAKMTSEQRKETTLQETEDVAREDQILLFFDAPISRKQVDRVALNKMGDRFYMKKNGYMPYKSTPLGELQRDARKLGFRIETRYITEGKRRGTPTGYFIYNKKSDEGYPIMLNPRNNKEEAIKPLYKSRKQKPNYKIAKINTPNTTINVVEGAGPDSFEIATKDYKATEGTEGSTIIGFVKNKDFPGEKKKETRGEIFILQVGDKGKGTGTSLMLDALRLMKENGTKTVKFTVPSKEGKPFNESLVRKGYINLLKVSDRTGTSEYEITDKVLEDAPSIRKQQVVSKSNKKILESEVSKLSLKSVIQSVRKSNPDSSVIDILTDIYKGNTVEDFNYDYLNDEVLTYDALTDVLVSEEIFNSKREAINKLSVIGKGIVFKNIEFTTQSRKQKPSKKPTRKRTSSIKKAITEIKNVLKITPDEQRTIFKALNDQKKKAKEIKKDIVSSLRDLVKKGKITPSKMVSVINKVPDDFNNPTTVERFVEYMAKVFNDADYGNKMTIANSKKRRAKKNVSTKIGIADGLVQQLQRLFSVKPELIPSSVLEDYMSLINTFGQRATVLSLPDIKEVTQMTESILEQIDEEQSMAIELADRYEAAEKVYNKKTGDLDYAATIKQMLDNEVIDEREYEVMKKYKSVINPPAPATPKTEAEIEQKRQDTIESIRETKEVDPSILPSRLERDLAKKFQKLLKTDAIESLSLNDLKNLLKIIDNINNGYLPHYAQIMTGKMNAIENAKIGDQAIRRSKLLPISKIYARIKTKFTKKGAVQELIRRNPTFYIDQVFGDFRTKDIFDSIFRDSAEGSANYTKAIKEIQAKIEKAEQAVLKSFKRNPNKTLMSKYKQMSYLVQQEFLSNPDSNQVNSVEDFIKATLKRIKQETTSYTENDAKMLQEILDTYTDNGTKTFDNVALYESFNVAERNSIKTLEEINNSLTERAVYTANIIRGNKITPLKNYTHLSVIPEVGKNDIMETESSQVSDMFNKYLKPSTKAKSLIQRTGKASALNFDVYASVQRGSKYTLMDFHLTEPIRTSRRTLNQIEKNLSDENGMMPGDARIKFNAIRDASIESIENLLSNALTQSSFADQVVNDIQKQGYRAILAGAPRAAYELISNLGAVVFIDPKGFSAGVKLRKIIGSPDGKNIMTNLDSTETNRVFSTGLSGKFVDTGILNQAAGVTASKAKGRAVNTLLQLWNNTGQRWKKGVEFTADTLISSPDKLIMQPTWFGAFENRFKKITGKSPDFDKIAANDEVYMDKYASALKESTKLADSRSVLIGATDNAFMGILKGTVKPNQSVMLKAFNSFNGFMTRFLIFEYITARTGIMALVTKGTVSKKQGAALMAGVTTRMVLYTFLGTLVGETIKSLTEEEDEEDFDFSEAQYEDDSSKGIKSVEKMLGQAFVSTFTSLLFGRDLGNATKSMINLGLEEFNEQYLQILRDGEYDKFRDAIQYTIIPEGKSGRGPKFFDIAQNLFAAFTPMLKTGVLAVNTAFDSDRKEPDAIKRQQDVRFIRLPLEILGTLGFIPLYKDVRKIVLANMYKGLRKAQAESDSNKKIKEQMLQGYNSESDMKRYDLPLWEVTFGPDSPGYDRRQAQKELKRKERKLKKLMKDELYNYSPKTKSRGRKSSPFGSGDSGKSSSPFGSSKGSGKSSSPFGG